MSCAQLPVYLAHLFEISTIYCSSPAINFKVYDVQFLLKLFWCSIGSSLWSFGLWTWTGSRVYNNAIVNPHQQSCGQDVTCVQILASAAPVVHCSLGRINSPLLLLSSRRHFVVPKKCRLCFLPNASLHDTADGAWTTDWAELLTGTRPSCQDAQWIVQRWKSDKIWQDSLVFLDPS